MDYQIPPAEARLRQAFDLYRRTEKEAKASKNIVADWDDLHRDMDTSIDLVEEAEKLDQTVSIENGPEPIKVNLLKGKLLFLQGWIETREGLPDHALRSGIEAFKGYLEYKPNDIPALNELTEAYIRVFDRPRAEAANTLVLGSLDKFNETARKIRDRLVKDQRLGRPLNARPISPPPKVTSAAPRPPHGGVIFLYLTFLAIFCLLVPVMVFIVPIHDFFFTNTHSSALCYPVFDAKELSGYDPTTPDEIANTKYLFFQWRGENHALTFSPRPRSKAVCQRNGMLQWDYSR